MSRLASGTAPPLIIAHSEDVGGMQVGVDIEEPRSKGEFVVWTANIPHKNTLKVGDDGFAPLQAIINLSIHSIFIHLLAGLETHVFHTFQTARN
jgi:hypothetical protein